MTDEIRTNAGFVEVRGAPLYYEDAGTGSALVLIHEGIADSRMYDDQFDALARHYRVVRYDLHGFGYRRLSHLRGDRRAGCPHRRGVQGGRLCARHRFVSEVLGRRAEAPPVSVRTHETNLSLACLLPQQPRPHQV
jgi:pimeloyl-ACP methyl ester carboxylesterase